LTVTDRRLIQQMLELRPASALAYRLKMSLGYIPTANDSVRIQYVDPDLPLVSTKRRKKLLLARRAYEASITKYERRIVQFPHMGVDTGTIWIPMGDSLRLAIREDIHRPGRIFGNTVTSDSMWTTDNSAIATVWSKRSFHGARVQTSEALLTARDTGQTVVRLTGLHGPSDTMPSRVPVAKTATRKVIVTRPVSRIQIEPRIQKIAVGGSVSLQVNVRDDWGRIIPGVPTRLWVSAMPWPQMYDVVGTRLVQFDSAGSRTVIAQFAGRADTMVVIVEARPRR
jgi:hypothetical protein